MTNYQRWCIYTRNLTSPQSWIDFTWYFTVSAALQRRVWLYDEEMPLFPNQYGLLVGPPGLGKGIVLDKAAGLLKHHKWEKGIPIKTAIGTEHPPLFAMGSDSITFEELVADVASSARFVPTPDGEVYRHCSYAFVLEELSSLFKHKTSDVIKFLQNAYDCKEYEYKTKHQGKDYLRRLCLSFLAGTQPDFLKEAAESKIFGQGFASRSLFLFETEERFSAFHISLFTPEQLEAKNQLLEYIKRLATIYGRVTYDHETFKFLEDWYQNKFVPARKKAHPKMLDYMARKKVMMLKYAMAMHYSERTDMVIPLETFVKAINFMDSIEPQMEAGLCGTGRNELNNYARKILSFIKQQNGVEKKFLILHFSADLNVEEIDKAIEQLEQSGQIKGTLDPDGKKRYRSSTL